MYTTTELKKNSLNSNRMYMYLKHYQSFKYDAEWLYLKCILDSPYNNNMWYVCPCIGLWCLMPLLTIFQLYRGVHCIRNHYLKIVSAPSWTLFLKDIS